MITLPDLAPVRPLAVLVLYRNKLTHPSVSHQTPAVRLGFRRRRLDESL